MFLTVNLFYFLKQKGGIMAKKIGWRDKDLENLKRSYDQGEELTWPN